MKSKLIAMLAILLTVMLGFNSLAHGGQVTKNSYEDSFPQIKGNYLVWQGYVDGDWKIFLYNIEMEEIHQITDNDYGDISPQTDGEYVVWLGCIHSGGEIFLYNIASGNTKRAHLSVGLGNVNPSHSFGTVSLGTKRLLDFSQERFRSTFTFEDILNGYPVVEFVFKRFSFFVDKNMFPVRPLGSTGITPLLSYYGPVRLPTRATKGLFLSQRCCGWGHTLPGLPGSSTNLSARAVPYHPGEPDSCIRPLLHCRHWASPILDGWPLSQSITRSKRVRLRYGSRFRLTRLRQIRLPCPTLDRLLVKRTIYKVNSFQFTRLTRLCLAHQDLQDILSCPSCKSCPKSNFLYKLAHG